jgi:CheY-like chemotaxis protein
MCHINLQLQLQGAHQKHQKLCALVVDDHPVNRLVLGAMVERLGFEAVEACDGLAALQEMRK